MFNRILQSGYIIRRIAIEFNKCFIAFAQQHIELRVLIIEFDKRVTEFDELVIEFSKWFIEIVKRETANVK